MRAISHTAPTVDLTSVVTAFDFESVWQERRTFLVEGVELSVARLSHIIRSKAATNRGKGRLAALILYSPVDAIPVDLHDTSRGARAVDRTLRLHACAAYLGSIGVPPLAAQLMLLTATRP